MSDSFATLLSVICHAPLSMGFSRQEYWSRLPFPSSGIFLTQGSNLRLLDWQEDYLQLSHYTKHAAAAAKSLQSCPTLCDPIDGSPPGSPVPGILQEEHWSGLPFPSPMHESGSEVAQSCPTLSDPMDCRPPGSSTHGIFQARVLEWVAIVFSGG